MFLITAFLDCMCARNASQHLTIHYLFSTNKGAFLLRLFLHSALIHNRKRTLNTNIKTYLSLFKFYTVFF